LFLTFAAAAAGHGSTARSAYAECAIAPVAPTVSILFDDTWSPDDRLEIFKNLQVSLKLQGYVSCASFDARSIATIHISKDTPALAPPSSRVLIEISWRGPPTQASVSRWLNVSSFDADARGLAIAIAADEMFTTTLARQRRHPAPLAPVPPPSPPRFRKPSMVTSKEALSTPKHFFEERAQWLNVGPTVSAYANAVVLFGAALDVEMYLANRWALRVGGDISIDPGRDTEGGQITQRQISGVLGIVAYLLDTRWASLALEIDGVVGWLRIKGEPSAGFVGSKLDRGIFIARGGLAASWKTPGFRCQFLLLGGAPVLGVATLENGNRDSGLFGPMLTAAIRIGIGL